MKFGAAAQKIKSLCTEIEARAATPEYSAILSDIQFCYFQQRRLLLQDIVSKHLKEIMDLTDIYKTVRAFSFYQS